MAEAEYTAMEIAAARELCSQHAEVCNVDKDDAWTFHGAEFLDDARKVLNATAAPELLSELKTTTFLLTSACLVMEGAASREIALAAVKRARAAIAKATGSAS